MKSYSLLSRYGVTEAGKVTSIWTPNQRRGANKSPVVLCHGSGAAWGYIEATRSGGITIGPFLAMAGVPCIAGEFGGQAWANDTAMNTIDAAITYIKSQLGITADKVHLLGISMGGATAIRYSSLHPEKVASASLIIPLCDINAFYNVQAAATKNEIAAAWGVASGAALPAGADLPTLGVAMKDTVPSRIYYSSTDASIDPATQIAMGPIIGSEAVVNVGTNGHSELSISDAVNRGGLGKEISDFMKRNGA